MVSWQHKPGVLGGAILQTHGVTWAGDSTSLAHHSFAVSSKRLD